MTQVKALCPFQIFLEKREAPAVRLRALLPFNPSTSSPSPLPRTGRGLRGSRGGNVNGWFISSLLFTLHETNAGQLKEGIVTLPGLGLSLHRFFQQLQALEEWISLWIVTINYLSILQNAALSSLFADFSTNRTSQLSTLLGNFVHYWKKLYNTLFCSDKNEPPDDFGQACSV